MAMIRGGDNNCEELLEIQDILVSFSFITQLLLLLNVNHYFKKPTLMTVKM